MNIVLVKFWRKNGERFSRNIIHFTLELKLNTQKLTICSEQTNLYQTVYCTLQTKTISK